MNLHQVTSAIDAITLCITYIIAETLGGAFRAWVAAEMGDDTPQELGFLSLNPLAHIDPLGLFCLMFFHYGWGNHVPVNPYNFYPPYSFLKQAITYFSKAFLHIIMGTIVSIFLICSFGLEIFNMPIATAEFTHLYPTSSSLAIGIALISITFVYVNAMLAGVSLIANAVNLILFNFFPDMYEQTVVVVACSLIAFVFLAYPIIRFMLSIILYTSVIIMYCTNLC